MAQPSVTIVGASLAGLRGAEALRRDGFDGPITVIGAEAHLPYDRPPLSKQVLAGDWNPERVMLTTPEAVADLKIEFHLSTAATSFDLASRTLLTDGQHVGTTVVDRLMIATGARCRSLPGTESMAGVHVLRDLDHAIALRADLDAMPGRVVVIGAGFIGAEVASTCRGRGLDVTMIEAAPTPLSHILGDEIGGLCAAIHRENGVDLRTGVGVAELVGDDRVRQVRLVDGTLIDAEVVVVGIGVIPNTEWLEGSGLEIDNGVVCDSTLLAAERVTAAGDVARWPNQLFDETMRVEHWDNAVQMGVAAARRLLVDASDAVPFEPAPLFWSDQYDRKIQLAGRMRLDDDAHLLTGSFDERKFAIAYSRDGQLVGVLGFSRPRHVVLGKGLIEQRASLEDALAALS